MEYLAIVERGGDGSYSAYLPDLPGCVACGDTLEEIQQLIDEAVELHIASLREHNEPVPPAVTRSFTVHAKLPA